MLKTSAVKDSNVICLKFRNFKALSFYKLTKKKKTPHSFRQIYFAYLSNILRVKL